MSVEVLRTKVRQLHEEAWAKGNVDILDKLCATDYIQHLPPYPDVKGIEALRQLILGIHRDFSDLQGEIAEIIVEGDACASRYSWQGVHRGTGKKVTVAGCLVSHFVNGKIAEEWANENLLGLYQQIGFKLVPP
jgi:predicted ester cyclase